jgi:hypothetical protein
VDVDEGTIRTLRKSTAEYSAVEKTVGRDGKSLSDILRQLAH